ncbi:MAG: hypothetical protein M0P69_15120 [Bacteroidales bacterium]|nr:hypothetical protein [Bacteroidales bacterium]
MRNTRQTTPTFPEVRALMAKHGKTQLDMGKVTGTTYITYGKKLNNEVDFSMSDMLKIRTFFITLGEDPKELTMERLFFAWKNHNSEEV